MLGPGAERHSGERCASTLAFVRLLAPPPSQIPTWIRPLDITRRLALLCSGRVLHSVFMIHGAYQGGSTA